eukprot:Amastigsp_a8519_5.p3 type:complete len:143 gc:universal Amastigsp_a8519_5:630-202(-)
MGAVRSRRARRNQRLDESNKPLDGARARALESLRVGGQDRGFKGRAQGGLVRRALSARGPHRRAREDHRATQRRAARRAESARGHSRGNKRARRGRKERDHRRKAPGPRSHHGVRERPRRARPHAHTLRRRARAPRRRAREA